MKVQYYLRGFGCGVIVATLFMIIAITVSDKINKNEKDIASGGEINATVEKSSSESESSKNENTTTIEMYTTAEEHTTTEKYTKTQNVTTDENKETTDVTVNAEEFTTTETTPVETTNTQSEEKTVTLHIRSGMTSNEVANQLEKDGIVDSGYELNMYLYNNGYESKLRVGTYEISKGMTYSQIASIITK